MIRRTIPAAPIAAAVLVALAVCAAGCATRQITARTFRVLRVVDGDTFVVRYDGDPTRVRIANIDAPEARAPGGAEATEMLKRLIDDREVRLVFSASRKRDHFGRLLARVFADGLDVGEAMIARGRAKRYKKAKGTRE